MDNNQQPNNSFSPHVIDQINHLLGSAQSHTRGGHQGRRSNRQYQTFDWDQTSSAQNANHGQIRRPQHQWSTNSRGPPDMNSFPPLGASNSPQQHSPYQQQHQQPQTQPEPQPQQQQPSSQSSSYHQQSSHLGNSHPAPIPSQVQPQVQQRFARYDNREPANYRQNFGARGASVRAPGGVVTHSRPQHFQSSADDYRRPPPSSGRLYNPGPNPQLTAEQQRAFRHKIMSQSDFLGSVASYTLKHQISKEEYQEKETFRRTLQALAQKAITLESQGQVNFNVEDVKLKLYGSLGSGFGVAGSDMDLLLTFPKDQHRPNGIEIESRRWLEKYLLEAGYGARLLTNTRVPILKVCERPGQELLENLRAYRKQWEESLETTKESLDLSNQDQTLPPPTLPTSDVVDSLENLSLEAAQIALPDSPSNETVKLDFVGDCGIQCDINFTNYVALRNTELLRTYGSCDPRVRQVGLFVKHWAKARDINTPYKGTLSSYGYIMLVLHYLMNVVTPPLIPNLQALARERDEWEHRLEIEKIEGFDVRFIRDPEELQSIMGRMPPNHESLGSLLRGFFWFYGCHGGFHWMRDAVSIRTRGGRITKQSKGWTEAKWSDNKQNVRLRYLLAIEDPFETEHNIGRTVVHGGIVAIRDEFRRAWSMIDNIQFDEVSRNWFWLDKGERKPGDGLMDPIENRGDLLRRDHEAHRAKIRQMRQEVEAKEQALKEASVDDSLLHESSAKNGTCMGSDLEHSLPSTSTLSSETRCNELIHSRSNQDMERVWRQPGSRRQVLDQSDDSDEELTTGSTAISANGSLVEEKDPLSQQQSMWLDLSEQDNSLNTPATDTNNDVHRQQHKLKNASWDNSELEGEYQWYDHTEAKCEGFSTGVDVTEPVGEVHHDVSGDDVVGQRRDQFETLGDAIFARNRNAQPNFLPHSLPPRADKKVGRQIFWDQHTKGGRWLFWRDRLITAGHWKPPRQAVLVALDTRFSFDPSMSYAELHQKNQELQRLYKSTLFPEQSDEQTQGEEVDHPKSTITHPHAMQFEAGPNVHHDLRKDHEEASGNLQASSRPEQIEHMQVSKAVLEPRTRYESLEPPSAAMDINHLRELRLRHFTQKFTRTEDTRKGDGAVAGAVNNEMDVVYPDESTSAIPQTGQSGFSLDQRQLQDLEVIKRGGNGCARRGEHFNIEEDYEWGGGGAMGHRSSSGGANATQSTPNQAADTGSDHKRLLDELPRSIT